MEDEKEIWTMTFIASMLAQTIGRSVNGVPFTAGHVRDMKEAATLVADESIAVVKQKFPKGKGKGHANP